jgi:hypothetical protein
MMKFAKEMGFTANPEEPAVKVNQYIFNGGQQQEPATKQVASREVCIDEETAQKVKNMTPMERRKLSCQLGKMVDPSIETEFVEPESEKS